jgi:hypothetical protein
VEERAVQSRLVLMANTACFVLLFWSRLIIVTDISREAYAQADARTKTQPQVCAKEPNETTVGGSSIRVGIALVRKPDSREGREMEDRIMPDDRTCVEELHRYTLKAIERIQHYIDSSETTPDQRRENPEEDSPDSGYLGRFRSGGEDEPGEV